MSGIFSRYPSGSFSGAISVTKSYGTTRSDICLADRSGVTHHVLPGDTLQSLSIKYGVSIEKLKRVNKLWANDVLFLRKTLLIPKEVTHEDNDEDENIEAQDSDENINRYSVSPIQDLNYDNLTLNRYRADHANTDSNNRLANGDDFDNQAYDKFLTRIDDQLKKFKPDQISDSSQPATVAAGPMPDICYDSYQNKTMSPTKHYPDEPIF